MRIDFHPSATCELEASANWYAEHSVIAGRKFAVAVDAALHKIGENPERFLRIDARHQVCGVEKFPFQIVFRQAGGKIFVVAIAHAKRRPDYWSTR